MAAASAAGPGGHGFRAAEVTGSPGGSGCTRSGMNRRVRVEGMWLGGEDLNQKGSFIHKPTQGWLHPDKKIVGQGASYIVRVSQTVLFLEHQNILFFFFKQPQKHIKNEHLLSLTGREAENISHAGSLLCSS